MQRCIDLARLGDGYTHPNPMVGSVIVHNDMIIGEGWHREAGQPHAEVVAIESVVDKTLLQEATLYVNLEPCSHHGRTPPCANRIVEEGIRKVVIGTIDPHSKVAGSGVAHLKQNGVEVVVGVLDAECKFLNRAFFNFHRFRRPYISLKWAQSRDGYLAPDDDSRQPEAPLWITGPQTKQGVHRLRARVDAILVGGKTVVMDNPSLTTRVWPGKSPLRIIWTNRPIDGNKKVMNDGDPTLVVGQYAKEYGYQAPIQTMECHTAMELLHELYEIGITHLLVEGGAHTINQFVSEGLWDEAFVLIGDKVLESGVSAPRLEPSVYQTCVKVDSDTWTHYTQE